MLKIGMILVLSWILVGCSEKKSSLTSSSSSPASLGAPPLLRAGVEPPMTRDPLTGEFVLRANTDAPIIETTGQDFE